jgi:hypothetical protein
MIEDWTKTLARALAKQVEELKDSNSELISGIEQELIHACDDKLGQIESRTVSFIETTDKLQVKSEKRFESYLGRKKAIDILVYINLSIVPLLVIYLVFFKK